MSRNPYVRPVSKTGWWLTQPRYMRYMAREVTCVFVGAFTLLLVCALRALAAGPQAWAAFVASLSGPVGVGLLLVTLAFSVYHSATWFNLTPKAMPIQVGEKFLPGYVIIGAHYGAWALVSLVVFLLAGGF